MVERLGWIRILGTNPYRNLAVEECLTSRVGTGELLLLLWQNQKSVVVGRNQNCFEECRADLLREEGGLPVRRRSGGGAVYHDLGNLNFSFITCKEDCDLERQFRVVVGAVRSLGIEAEVSGRNDILAEGRKVSGSAFLEAEGKCCHHGTLMVSVEKEMLSRYLRTPGGKLSSKGIKSVRSRVANLSEWRPELTTEQAEEALKWEFGRVYGKIPVELPAVRLDERRVAALTERFASEKWIYGRKIPFTHRMEERFPWGAVEILLEVNGERVVRAEVYSDAMNQDAISQLRDNLAGCRYGEEDLLRVAGELDFEGRSDLEDLIRRQVWEVRGFGREF